MIKESIFNKMTLHAKRSFVEAEKLAAFYGSKVIKQEHLLFAISMEKGSLGSNILRDFGFDRSVFDKAIGDKTLQKNPSSTPPKDRVLDFEQNLKDAIVKAYSLANKFRYPYVGTEHLVFSVIEKPNKTVKEMLILSSKNKPKISADTPAKKMIKISSHPGAKKESGNINANASHLDKTLLNDLLKALNMPGLDFPPFENNTDKESETPALDYFCANLNKKMEKENKLVIGREKELEQIITALGRKEKNNPLLIGDPGVGKTALVEGLAERINSGDVPYYLTDKKILSLDISSVVAGTSFRGEFEQRLKDIIAEASENDDVILFIDEIHGIIGAGNASGGLDAANILKPVLTQGNIQCIGATTLTEYKKYIEKDSALDRRFQTIIINEPSPEETEKILRGIKKKYEKFHNVSITDDAIHYSVLLSSRYIQDRFQPDKAIDLIDETSARLRYRKQNSKTLKELAKTGQAIKNIVVRKNELTKQEKYDEALRARGKEEILTKKQKQLEARQKEFEKKYPITIEANDIAETVSAKTGIPLSKIQSKVSDKLNSISRKLKMNIIGQEEATQKISETVLRSQSGVGETNKPIGSFLFLGPSGVGKTLTAKIMAQEFFEDKNALIKIDMSEFMERHSVSQLLGAPAGYVGYGEGGKLTEQIRRQPYSLVLFDEIEKAHPDVFNILLQILEDGTLTDAEGRKVDFTNTVIILTSNIGTEEFRKTSEIGFSDNSASKKATAEKIAGIKEKVIEELQKKIKPEILNRLDDIIVFNPLSQNDLKKIIKLELNNLKKRLKNNIDINLVYANNIIDFILKQNPLYHEGARYIKKNIRDLIENKVAKKISLSENRPEKISLEIKNKRIVVK